MAIVAVSHCHICDAVTAGDLLCPLHQEAAEQFTHHLRGVSKFEQVRTANLTVDHRFQRPLNEPLVRKIIVNFNEYDLGHLTVSRRAHESVLLDGQQRWTALIRMGFVEAPCEVFEGLTYEQEVMIFVVRNRDRVAVRKGILFNDQAQAGIRQYVDAVSILDSFNFKVVDPGSRKPVSTTQLSCPSTIEKVYGMGQLGPTLSVIRDAWPDQPEASRAEVLLGIAAFLTINPHVTPDQLATRLGRFDAQNLVDTARTIMRSSVERRLWVHFYYVVVERYNWNMKTNRVSRVEISSRAPNMWMG